MPYADYIVFLQHGRIAEQGTYAELMAADSAFAQMMREYGGAQANQAEASGEAEPSVQSKAENNTKEAAPGTVSASSVQVTAEVNAGKVMSAVVAKAKPGQGRELMTKEERSTGSVSWDVYAYYLNSLGSFIYPLMIFVAVVLAQGSKIVADYWLAIWTDNSLRRSLEFYLGIYGALGASQVILTVCATVTVAFVGQRAALILHDRAFANLLRAPLSFFDTTPIGRILNRFSKDQDVIDAMLPETFRMCIMMITMAIFTFAVIAIVSPWFLLPFIPIMIVYYRTQKYYRHASREIKRLDAIARSPLFAHFSETLSGLSSIRAYREQERFITANQEKLDQNNRAYYIQLQSQRWLSVRLETTGSMITFSAAMIAAALRSSISPGLVGLSISYAISVTGMLNWMIRQSVELELAMNSVERAKFYTDQIPQEKPHVIEEQKPSASWPSQGEVEFQNLDMRYRPGLPLVLQEVSVKIPGSCKVGVVGRTGAGKSSLMAALFRLIEPANGTIKVDGIDITTIGLKDLRSRLAIIPQDAYLYSGTLRYNLDPFNSFSDEDIWWALEKSFLKPAIEALPQKLGALVAENGENFSVGQRAQVCLARALLRRSKILVLDEATASVDMETDENIQRTVRNEFGSATILTIAHRLNTIVDYDRVLVMEFGRVKEYDTPANLLRNPNSAFSAMVAETGEENANMLRNIAFQAEQSSKFAVFNASTVSPAVSSPQDSAVINME